MTKQVTDKMVNTFTQAMLLSMPEVEDHYDQVKLGLEAVFNLASGNQEVDALKESNETWRKQWASERYEVEQLKAQVNCLRDALLNTIMYRKGSVNYGDPLEALEATPEQCLAEVRAKAIEDACKEEGYTDCDGDKVCPTENLLEYANNIRKQAK